MVAGGVLLVYGLMQRQAIAKQMASGRYSRLSLLAFVVLVGLATVGYTASNRWTPHGREPPDENVFGGARPVSPTTAGDETVTQYEPSVSWLPIAAVIALVGVAVIAYVASGRRTRRARDPRAELARGPRGRSGRRARRPPRRGRPAARGHCRVRAPGERSWPPPESRGSRRRRPTSTSGAFSATSS